MLIKLPVLHLEIIYRLLRNHQSENDHFPKATFVSNRKIASGRGAGNSARTGLMPV